MPQVWWPWLCQLVGVDAANGSTVVDLISVEPARINMSAVPAGTPFTLRLERAEEPNGAEWQTLLPWADAGATVTVLAGRDRRSAWVCLSRGHERLVLTGVRSPRPGTVDRRAPRVTTCLRPPSSGVNS